MTVRVSADVGGTFTDIVVVDGDGRVAARKLPSTPDGFERAVVDGTAKTLAACGLDPASVSHVVHGTTAATNAVLERSGPTVGLITTAGFRDVLEIGRLRTPRIYDLHWTKPPALARRRYRLEVDERIAADGSVIRAPSLEPLAARVDRAVAEGVGAFAISLLNAHANAAHEDLIAAWLRSRHPSLAVTMGSDVIGEIGEFERTSTAVLNAYLQPVVSGYLQRLAVAFCVVGVDAPILVMQSSGGMLPVTEAADVPIRLLESGPAAGALAAARVAELAGERHAVGFDMGGTTAKASLIEDFEVATSDELDIGSDISSSSRLLRGGGYTVRLPVIDLAEVGAGGGSIARVDAAGALRVGPESAGADPGPACYRRGGTRPTVTDANLVLGYLSPDRLNAAGVEVDIERAREALESDVADPLGLSVDDAALAVHAVADQQMARVLRAVTTERGRDLTRHALIVFGGSGGLHAASLASAVRMERVIVPPLAGVLSAVGMLWAPVQLDATMTVLRPLDATSLAGLDARLDAIAADLRCRLGRASSPGVELADTVTTLDLRYRGQATELPLKTEGSVSSQLGVIEQRFHALHRQVYGHGGAGPVEVVRARVAAVTPRPSASVSADPTPASSSSRRVYFDVGVFDAPVLSRAALREPMSGPVLIDEPDATLVVPPHWSARLVSDDLVVLERAPAAP